MGGPALVRLFYSTIRFLERHVAEAHQYLRIVFRDGTIEHVRGPTARFENPTRHRSIKVLSAIVVDNSSSIVVNRYDKVEKLECEDGRLSARQLVIKGPITFYPLPSDQIHSFSWGSGSGVVTDENRVISLKATLVRELKIVAQSADDHSVTVHLTLRVRLLGVAEVLAVTDPVSACDGVAQAAVRDALAGEHFATHGSSLAAFVRSLLQKEHFSEKLSSSLVSAACALVGVSIGDVQLSKSLALLHRREDDLARAKVTEKLADNSLMAKLARQEQEQKLEAAKQTHALRLAAERHEAELLQSETEAKRAVIVLQELKKAGVDLTRYVCVQDPEFVKKNSFGFW